MKVITLYLIVTSVVASERHTMEPYVVGGEFAKIEDFAYSAFIAVRCKDDQAVTGHLWMCGGSILNQYMLLTAAHCLYTCSEYSKITTYVGHVTKLEGAASTGHSFLLHQGYSEGPMEDDIALIRLQTALTFDSKVKRIVIIENPPYKDIAIVAGWGRVDEINKVPGKDLKFASQYVWEMKECRRKLGDMPDGFICAEDKDKSNYASVGDSGSALVVKGYIQIGIVSYKVPDVSTSLVVYADVGYYYNWILKYSNKMICS